MINVIETRMDIPGCVRVEATGIATLDHKHIGMLSEPVLHSWPSTKAEGQKELQPYWSFRERL